MAFSDYKTLAQAQTQFKIKYREEAFIPAQELAPSLKRVTNLDKRTVINLPFFQAQAASGCSSLQCAGYLK